LQLATPRPFLHHIKAFLPAPFVVPVRGGFIGVCDIGLAHMIANLTIYRTQPGVHLALGPTNGAGTETQLPVFPKKTFDQAH
jgi:hypothetical protein